MALKLLFKFKAEPQQSKMVQYSDSSDGEDEKEKRANKEGGKVITKALPQEQATIRFKFRGLQASPTPKI